MAVPTLEGRLLCASEVAYSALQSGTINPANSAPYYIGSGFIEPPTAIADGPELIDACVIGRTPDGVVVAFRGTQPIDDRTKPLKQRIRDWCNDFRADLVSSPGLPGASMPVSWRRSTLSGPMPRRKSGGKLPSTRSPRRST